MKERTTYPSSLTDEQYLLLDPLLPGRRNNTSKGGAPEKYTFRQILDGILYLMRTGIPWRYMPHDLPPWEIVYHYWRAWEQDGTWERINDALREQVRVKAGKKPTPSAGVLDSQSVKSVHKSERLTGYDAGKKVKGIKRHVLTDTTGMLLDVAVTPANWSDVQGGRLLNFVGLAAALPEMRCVFADSSYTGLVIWVAVMAYWLLRIVKGKKEQKGFEVQPMRWIVERTFGWISKHRRLRCDYEGLPETSRAAVYVAMIDTMVRRLKPAELRC